MAATEECGKGLKVELFGAMSVTCDGKPLPKLRARKGLWLLAYLALKPNTKVPREWLAAMLWPDSQEPRQVMRRVLTDLRGALGSCEGCLVATTQWLSLEIPPDNVDAIAFDRLARSATLEDLDAAIQLYRGPLLPECREIWSDCERFPRAETYVETLRSAAQAYRASGQETGRAITYLRLATKADPLRECMYLDLMETLAANGEAAEAIQVYRSLRILLHEETRTEPSHEITDLYRTLLSAGHVSRPLRSTQTAEATQPAAARPTNLPRPLTEILGRCREMADIAAELDRSRLVTLVGMGGLGKTRLVIEAGHRILERFTDGVWFVDLASIADGALVARTVAAVLEIREESERPLSASLTGVLAERCMLIVMDNCEHVLDSAAQLIRTLVAGCPNLSVLATSRQPLGLTGEIAIRIEPLPLPCAECDEAGASDPEAMFVRSPAVALFVERAVAAHPAFPVNPGALAVIAEVCRRLDGIPLAIELAAARVRSLSIEQIAVRLENRFRLLTIGDRAAPQRQQTLRGLVDWSYDLLEPQTKRLFARLSIFAGGWTLEAAENVCSDPHRIDPSKSMGKPASRIATVTPADGASLKAVETGHPRGAPGEDLCEPLDPAEHIPIRSEDVLDLLADLVEKSLVVVEWDAEGQIRYRMLETLRQYAAEKLDAGRELQALRRRHLLWCVEFSEAAEQDMRGPKQAARLREAARDNDNLRLALQQAPPGVERLRLAGALFWHWYIHGFFAEGRGWLEQTLAEAPDAPAVYRCKAIKAAGDICWALGDMDAARALHERNMQIYCETEDLRGVGMTYNSLGLISYHQGDCVAAIAYYRQGLALLREHGDPATVGVLLMNLALPIKEQGDYAEAEALLAEADDVNRRTDNKQGLAVVLHSRCIIAKRLGDYPRAIRFIMEALELDRSLGHLQGEAVDLHTLGEIAFYQRDLEAAERWYRDALGKFVKIGARRFVAASLCALGDVFMERGDLDQARRHHIESLDIETELNNRLGMANSIDCLAALDFKYAHFERAATLLAAVAAEKVRLGTPLAPNLLEKHEQLVAGIRQALGDARYEKLWEAGYALSLSEAALSARAGSGSKH